MNPLSFSRWRRELPGSGVTPGLLRLFVDNMLQLASPDYWGFISSGALSPSKARAVVWSKGL
jgi:hypothetical protein